MDFNRETLEVEGHGTYDRVDPTLLPNLFIAYNLDLGKESGRVLNDIKVRYDKGDKMVIETLEQIAGCAEEGREALLAGDRGRLHELMDLNFDLRSKIMEISERNKLLVKTARTCGASAKFAGSGGSNIGIFRDDEMLSRLMVELHKIQARVIKPYVM